MSPSRSQLQVTPVARPRRAFGRGVRKIPNYEWSVLQSVNQSTVPVASKVLLGSFSLTQPQDRTIVRTRGLLQLDSDQVLLSEQQSGALGLTIVSDDALAAGIASIPGPISDASNDWFLWQAGLNVRTLVTATGMQEPTGMQYTLDSKAQRVFQIGTSIAVVFENARPGAGGGIQVMFAIRILTRLRA